MLLPLQRQATTRYETPSSRSKRVLLFSWVIATLAFFKIFCFVWRSLICVCSTGDLTRVHGWMWGEYEQKQFSCCGSIKFLQIEGEIGKNNRADGSERVYSVSENHDSLINMIAKTTKRTSYFFPLLVLKDRLTRALWFCSLFWGSRFADKLQ